MSKPCKNCKTPFLPANNNQRYCSEKCKREFHFVPLNKKGVGLRLYPFNKRKDMKQQCEITFSNSVPENSQRIVKLTLEALGIEISRDVTLANDIDTAFKEIKNPLITKENYKKLEGSTLYLVITEQVRYNGIDFNVRLKDKPSKSDISILPNLDEWNELCCKHCHGEMAEEFPDSFIMHILFGENPAVEILEFFRDNKCELDFITKREYQTLIFKNYQYDYIDNFKPRFAYDIEEGLDS